MLFLSLMARANSSVLQHLANAVVRVGGNEYPGIFKTGPKEGGLGISYAGSQPLLQVASDTLMLEPVGETIYVNGTPYRIASVGPDNSGLVDVLLEEVQ
jgi:hypothetical protein